MATILVIDASPTIRETLRIVLGSEHAVALAPTWDDVTPGTRSELVIFGAPPPPRDDAGISAARQRLAPDAPLLLLNTPAEIDRRAFAPARHRIAFLPKPFDARSLRATVTALLAPETRATPSERVVAGHRQWLEAPLLPPAAAVMAGRAALTDLPVLLVGEPGSGAPEIARAIHFFSGRGGHVVVRPARGLAPAALCATPAPDALLLEHVDELPAETQASLLALLHDPDDAIERPRIFVTATAPLDAAVARGTFARPLAHALAALPIVLTPLRDRIGDLPGLLAHFSTLLTERLRLEPVVFTAAAVTRLQHYLWFDDLAELEAVVARTLALHRPRVVEPEMLLFDVADAARPLPGLPATGPFVPAPVVERIPTPDSVARAGMPVPPRPEPASPTEPVAAPGRPRVVSLERRRPEEPPAAAPPRAAAAATPPPAAPAVADDGPAAPSPALEVLLGELAHELRNPMVTIKTFAQHLDSVLDDPEVRARFATLAGDAINRMDALLETLLDFARFRAPIPTAIDLGTLAARALAERSEELAAKGVRVEQASPSARGATLVTGDESQILFALRSLVDGLAATTVPNTSVRIGTRPDGGLELVVHADPAVTTRLAGYVDGAAGNGSDAPPPLAFALAAALLRRNHGRLETGGGHNDATTVTVSLPPAAER